MDISEMLESPILQLPTGGWDWEVSQPEWMLDRHIPAKSVGMLFGPSNAGKSHLVCDMIIDVLAGSEDWQGIGLNGGDVVMFSESHGHIKARLKAYRNHKGKAIKHRMHTLPTMGMETREMAALCSWIYMLPNPPILMVFDTLATAFSIEENDNKEASKLIKALEEYILPAMHPLGSIMLVHHTSKASEGRTARGASALIGNIDYSINCQWDDDMGRTVAKWEKDRWRLMKEEPQWSGVAKRVPVAFTNGDTEMMVLDWSPYSEEEQEAARRLQEDLKMDAVKSRVRKAIESATKPVFIHTNSRARVPNGYVAFRLSDLVDRKIVPTMIDYIKEIFDVEPVFTPKGAEAGINVVGSKSP